VHCAKAHFPARLLGVAQAQYKILSLQSKPLFVCSLPGIGLAKELPESSADEIVMLGRQAGRDSFILLEFHMKQVADSRRSSCGESRRGALRSHGSMKLSQ